MYLELLGKAVEKDEFSKAGKKGEFSPGKVLG